jgi:hypothetical protein
MNSASLVFILVIPAVSLLALEDLQLTQHAVVMVEQAMAASMELSPESQAAFEQALTMLAERVNPETAEASGASEGEDMRAKLIQVALNRRNQPQAYAALRGSYIGRAVERPETLPQAKSPISTARVVSVTPEIVGEHATPDFRLAWEFYLLSPHLELSAAYFEFRVVEALSKIADPRSLLSIAHRYKVLAERSGAAVRNLNWALCRFPGQRGLSTVIEALKVWADSADVRKLPGTREATPSFGVPSLADSEWSASDDFFEQLVDASSEVRATWEKTVAAARSTASSEAEKAFLERFDAALALGVQNADCPLQ